MIPARLARTFVPVVVALLLTACGPAEIGGSAETAPDPSGAAAFPRGIETPDAETEIEVPEPPTGPGAFAPRLVSAPSGLLLTWLEPLTPKESPTLALAHTAEPPSPGHRLLFSRFSPRPGQASWSEPVVVAQGKDFFANWADFPSVTESGSGVLLAHWLEKNGAGTYAYGVRLARSGNDGATWEPLGWLHDDRSETEHGFVSLVPAAWDGDDEFVAVWLDGREMASDGPMTLRAARVGETVTGARVLDERVCECCATAAVATTSAAVVAYRDRTEGEVRDVSVALYPASGDGAGKTRVHDDGWVIAGCPVNGPALDAEGDRVVAAWFTAADGEPRVRAAFSEDGGRSFGEPEEVAADGSLGRVGVALLGREAVVSWLGREGDAGGESGGAAVWLRRVGRDGTLGAPWKLTATTASRRGGFPQLVEHEGMLYAAWVETAAGEGGDGETPERVRVRAVEPAALPGATAAPR